MDSLIRAYHAGDYLALTERADQRAKTMDMMPYLSGPHVHSIVIGGQVKAVAGLHIIAPHRALAFALIDPSITLSQWRSVIVTAREVLTFYGQTFTRIEAMCRADWPAAIRFLQVLGFEQEGRLRHLLPDGDGLIWRHA